MKSKASTKNRKFVGQNKFNKPAAKLDHPAPVTAFGGLSLLHRMAAKVGFARHLGEHVDVFKIRQGYSESDHFFNLVSTLFAGGDRLEDVGVLQEDEAYKKMLEADSISDPATLGDFLRRFDAPDIEDLRQAQFGMQHAAWRKLPKRRRQRASVDLDSTIIEVHGEKKEGCDFSYKGKYGYHPEFVTLAETHEYLDGKNRPGNITSGDDAVELLERNLTRVKDHFSAVCVRGDTAYGRQDVIDCCIDHGVDFALGWAAHKSWVMEAELLSEGKWIPMDRQEKSKRKGKRRKKRKNVRQEKVAERNYTDKRLKREWVAALEYPLPLGSGEHKPSRSCRMIVIRKQIETKDVDGLFDTFTYSFIITSLMKEPMIKLVKYYYKRCNQENLIEQGKNGVSVFTMPTGQFLANEVAMLTGMLAHNFKSWICLLALGEEKLEWEWKRFRFNFVNAAMRVSYGSRRVQLHLAGSRQGAAILAGLEALGVARC